MLVSIHVPKCAGTSFRSVLEKIFGGRFWPNYGTIFTRAQARPELVPPEADCIHGHFFADAFADLFPKASLVTWVRHPVERVVSNYHFFRRNPGIADECCRALHRDQLTLRQFADLEWMRNGATRYLAGKKIDAFAFVGVTERFADSLELFASAFHFRPDPAVPRENVNPDRAIQDYRISPEDDAYIRGRNLADLAFYEAAVNRLDRACGRVPARDPAS